MAKKHIKENANDSDIVYVSVPIPDEYFDEFGNPVADADLDRLDKIRDALLNAGGTVQFYVESDVEAGWEGDEFFDTGFIKLSVAQLRSAIENAGIEEDDILVYTEFEETDVNEASRVYDINSLIYDSDDYIDSIVESKRPVQDYQECSYTYNGKTTHLFDFKIGKVVYEDGWSDDLDKYDCSTNRVIVEIDVKNANPKYKDFEKIKFLSIKYRQEYQYVETQYTPATHWDPPDSEGYYEPVGDCEISEDEDGLVGYVSLEDAKTNDVSKEVYADDDSIGAWLPIEALEGFEEEPDIIDIDGAYKKACERERRDSRYYDFEENKSKKRVNEAITRKAKEKLNLLNDIVNFAYEYGEDEATSLFKQAFKKVTGDDLVDALNEEEK